ncbi:hypothetical protein FRC04_008261 [Tulasnella sp. 424]|nr:hypothetical protein FRC04_008261 [Tulasnella sp. 424]KAG8966921.1 hypothetical protein FRC05_002369 [Tulasnella sp. 425]
MSRQATSTSTAPFLRGRSPTRKRIPFEVLYECPAPGHSFVPNPASTDGRHALSGVTEAVVGSDGDFTLNDEDYYETSSPGQEFRTLSPDYSLYAETTMVVEDHPLSEMLDHIQTTMESSLQWVVSLHDRVGFRTEATQNLLRTFGHLQYWTSAVLEELIEEEGRMSITAFDPHQHPINPQNEPLSVNGSTSTVCNGSGEIERPRYAVDGPSDGIDGRHPQQVAAVQAIPEWQSGLQPPCSQVADDKEAAPVNPPQHPSYSSPAVHRTQKRESHPKDPSTRKRDPNSPWGKFKSLALRGSA